MMSPKPDFLDPSGTHGLGRTLSHAGLYFDIMSGLYIDIIFGISSDTTSHNPAGPDWLVGLDLEPLGLYRSKTRQGPTPHAVCGCFVQKPKSCRTDGSAYPSCGALSLHVPHIRTADVSIWTKHQGQSTPCILYSFWVRTTSPISWRTSQVAPESGLHGSTRLAANARFGSKSTLSNTSKSYPDPILTLTPL